MVKKLLGCAMAATILASAVPMAFAQTTSNRGAALQVAQNGTSGGATSSGMGETRNPAFDASAPPLAPGAAAGLETAEVISTPVLLGLAGAAVVAGVLIAASGGGNHTSTTTTTAH